MSLDYDFTAVADREIVVPVSSSHHPYFDKFSLSPINLWHKNPEDQSIRHPKPILERLAFLTMSVNLSEITESNIDEWCWRIGFLSEVGFNMTVDQWNAELGDFDEVPIRRHHIESSRGLGTNVADKDRAGFVQSIMKKKVQTARAIR